MKNILWFMILFSAGLLPGCSEDKGNYNYEALNTIEIGGFKPLNDNEGVYNVVQGTPLKITPDIRQAIEKDDDLSYLWLVEKDTVARTRDLDMVVDLTFGKKNCCYIVIENKTGIRYYHRFRMIVTSPYSMGYYILAEEEDESGLISFLPVEGTDKQFVSTNMVGSIKLGNSPAFASCTFDYNLDGFSMSFITKGGEFKMIQTNTVDFMPTVTLNDNSFLDSKQDYKFNPTYLYTTLASANFFVSNGQLISLVKGVLYRPAKGDYELAPWLADLPFSVPYLTAFDRKQHKFIHLRSQDNDQVAGIVGDANTCDKVLPIQGQEVVGSDEEIVNGYRVGYTTDQKVITRDASNLNFYTIDYSDTEAPKLRKDASIAVSGLNSKTQAILSNNIWYVLVGNTLYRTPMLLPSLTPIKEIPSDLGAVQAFNLCALDQKIIIATYDSHSQAERKGSVYFLDAASGEIELPGYKNVTGKAASIICPDKSPW